MSHRARDPSLTDDGSMSKLILTWTPMRLTRFWKSVVAWWRSIWA